MKQTNDSSRKENVQAFEAINLEYSFLDDYDK